jgi:hypothetical protein
VTVNAKFCPKCGTPRATDESKFCSDCGNTLEISDASTSSLPTLQRSYEGLTPDQVKVLRAFETELANFVNEYEISSIEIEDLEKLKVEPDYLFSKIEYFASGSIEIDGESYNYRTDEMLTAGVEDGALGVYLGKKPYRSGVPSRTFPYTTIIFYCADCEGDGCEKCDEEGRFIYEAVWDENDLFFTKN